jgi:hypothetical protein
MELPTGQMLHFGKGGKLHLEKSRYAMQVLYDPVGSEQTDIDINGLEVSTSDDKNF